MDNLLPPEARAIFDVKNTASFELDVWFERRVQQEDYVLVELGHSEGPVAAKQDFLDGRLYIGVEAWYYQMPTDTMRRTVFLLRSQKSDQNIVFIDNPTGRTGYVGETYDPETVLPAGIANEVFLGNVFGDPVIAFNSGRTESLLCEARRLMNDGGKILIRETYTPHYAAVEDQVISAGLEVAARFMPYDNPEIWAKLEELYAPLPNHDLQFGRPPHTDSFYLILTEPTKAY